MTPGMGTKWMIFTISCSKCHVETNYEVRYPKQYRTLHRSTNETKKRYWCWSDEMAYNSVALSGWILSMTWMVPKAYVMRIMVVLKKGRKHTGTPWISWFRDHDVSTSRILHFPILFSSTVTGFNFRIWTVFVLAATYDLGLYYEIRTSYVAEDLCVGCGGFLFRGLDYDYYNYGNVAKCKCPPRRKIMIQCSSGGTRSQKDGRRHQHFRCLTPSPNSGTAK